MYITVDTIITATSLLGAAAAITGLLAVVYKFYKKPYETEEKLRKLREQHQEDMRRMNEKQCLMTYGLLVCLKGYFKTVT